MTLAGILFDKDGTLIDFDATWGVAADVVMRRMSGGDPQILAALAEAMHFVPAERRFRTTSPMIAGSSADYGPMWASALGRVLDAALLSEIDAAFAIEGLAALTPIGAPHEIFAALRAAGLRLGLATNDSEAGARSQLERLGALDHLDFVAGYDSGFGIKPHPGMITAFAQRIAVAPDRIALVGDSVHDLAAARAAGAHGIAVLSGPAGRADLAAHADHLIETIADLPALLERAFGLPQRPLSSPAGGESGAPSGRAC